MSITCSPNSKQRNEHQNLFQTRGRFQSNYTGYKNAQSAVLVQTAKPEPGI